MKYLGAPQSGSQANTTASHNRAGQYYRNRRTPTQPVGTGRRAIVRANFSSAASYYGTLTPAQQAAWSAYAAMYPVRDALGQSITLTGQQMACAITANLLNIGNDISPLPPLSNLVPTVVSVSFTVTHAGVVTITVDTTGTELDQVCIAFSKPQSSGTSFCKTFWQAQVQSANTATPIVLSAKYTEQFGLPAIGNRVFYKITPVNQYGVSGAPTIGMAIVS